MNPQKQSQLIASDLVLSQFLETVKHAIEKLDTDCVVNTYKGEDFYYDGSHIPSVYSLEVNTALIGFYWVSNDENRPSHYINFSDSYVKEIVQNEDRSPQCLLPDLSEAILVYEYPEDVSSDDRKAYKKLDQALYGDSEIIVTEQFREFASLSRLLQKTCDTIEKRTRVPAKQFYIEV